ncbi:MAG: hypothetical protein ACPGTG_02295 [Flavobacteriales bacterium]
MKHAFASLLLVLICSGCGLFSESDNEDYLARYQDSKLRIQDFNLVMNKHVSPKDSLKFLEQFVNSWAKEQALLEHAQFNLQEDELEIQTLVERYKKSLITHRFEQKYLSQYLDTLISEQELEVYYMRNKSTFMLKSSILKLNYIRLSKDAPNLDEVKARLYLEQDDDLTWLEDYCHMYARRSYLNKDEWVQLDDFIEELPIKEQNKDTILNTKEVLVLEGETDYYLLKIVDFTIKDQIPPLNYVKDQVQNLILHQRKHKLLKSLENKLFENALEEGKFEFY